MRWPFVLTLLTVSAVAAIALARPGAPTPLRNNASDPSTYWSYQLLSSPSAPQVKNANWAYNDIDCFILAKLEATGLTPAADAEPAVLIRRAYFDLIGLPPTPDQIANYVADKSPDRFEKLVDRLLASPEFGRRWGRHWLDVARFGESLTLRGFVLKDAWRYRDYVIEAFNADRPFDQFMREQIAGDLMQASSVDERRRQLVATTFLVIGNNNLEEQDKKQLEMDVVDEQLGAIGTAFLAQTIGCARCHDHKFDPISNRDYYALAGILHSTTTLEHSNVSKWLEIPLPAEPAREAELERHESELAKLNAELSEMKTALARAGGAAILAVKDLPGIVIDDSHATRVGRWSKSTVVKSYVGDGYLTDDNDKSEIKTLAFHPEIPESGKYEVRFAYSSATNRATNVPVTIFSADGSETIKVDERKSPPILNHFISLGQHNFEKGGQGFVSVSNEATDSYVIANAVQFVPVDAANTATTTTAADKPKTPKVAVASEPMRKLEARIKSMTATGPHRDLVDSIREAKQIADEPINQRGNVHSPGDIVPRGFLHVLPTANLAIPQNQSGRLELGQWLSDASNPLPARVLANRIWHWTFGVGIVRTVDNLGTTGELPSHPELLDYLARRLVSEKWSVKTMVRLMATSHTYRLSSARDAKSTAADPDNRLYAHMNRRRMDAESIRDTILSVSGALAPFEGGSTHDDSLKSDFGFKQTGNYRSVYLPAFRNALPELFEAFDMADASVSTGRRNVSTVAPQSLFMLNSSFVQQQASIAANRLLKESASSSDDHRLNRAYEIALGRMPSDGERRAAIAFLSKAASKSPTETQESWSQIFHALFASMDFRYVN